MASFQSFNTKIDIMLQAFSLAEKVALVTGGTHGLRMAIATGLAKSGARIVINDIFEDKLETAKQEYLANDIEVATYSFDVTKEEQVKEGIAKIEAEVGGIDILVNNAGTINRTPAGKWGDPSDLAGTAVFLSSSASNFVK